MNQSDFIILGPWLIIAITSVLTVSSIIVYRSHRLIMALTLVGLALSALAVPWVAQYAIYRQVTPLLIIDQYAFFFLELILITSIAIVLLAYSYLKNRQATIQREEFYPLLLFAVLGAGILVGSSHLISFFLGLETLSLSLYAMIGYFRTDRQSIEAGIKYLVLAGASSAILLFGMALIYAELGTMQLFKMAYHLLNRSTFSLFIWCGLAMIIVGIGFKLAVVPFHMWTPDVYQGSPAPVTAFIATISKGAMFALLLRYFTVMGLQRQHWLFVIFSLIAIASMLGGTLLALWQKNIKRILAYSSISHLGYLLVAFLAGDVLGSQAVAYYLVAYFIMTVGAFGVIIVFSPADREAEELADYQGLFWRRPWLAASMTVFTLSLAGIPFTAGFLGKFYVLTAGISADHWALVLILIVSSTMGLFFYLRIIATMLAAPRTTPASIESNRDASTLQIHYQVPLLAGLVLTALVLLLVWFGIYPVSLQAIIKNATFVSF